MTRTLEYQPSIVGPRWRFHPISLEVALGASTSKVSVDVAFEPERATVSFFHSLFFS